MFKGKLPTTAGMSISIIEAEPQQHPLTAQELLLSGLRDVALGIPEELLYPQTPDTYRKLADNTEIDHPKHYRRESGLEAIDVIESWDLNFNLGNVVKYVCRAGLKDKSHRTEDLEKAMWYLSRELGTKE